MVVPLGLPGGGLGAVAPSVGLEGPQQAPCESPTTSIISSSSSTSLGGSLSAHGYDFHFFAIKQRGIFAHLDPLASL